MSTAEVPMGRMVPSEGRVDWALVVIVGLLVGFGMIMLVSASSLSADKDYGNGLHFLTRQAGGLAGGIVAGWFVLTRPWGQLRRLALPAFVAAVVTLIIVLTPLGVEANGAQRWISLGGINVQPSEFAKLAVILMLANYLDANAGRLHDLVGVVFPAVAIVAPILLFLMFEPDFGTTVVTAGIAGVLLFVAGLRLLWVFGLGALATAGGVVLIAIEPYRLERFLSFLDPFADPEGAGYQVVQGWIALASGGVAGAGLAGGSSQLGFLPEAHNDFIAAVVGEELGAIGWIAMVLLYVGLIWRGTRIAARAPDLFGTLVASGVSGMFAMQILVNLGVVGGLLPAKGLVLPFMSYGASAIAAHTIGVALLLRTAAATGRPST